MSMGSAERITTVNIVTNVLMSFLVGMFIFYIYRKTFHGVLYQLSFNVSLVLACTVTSLMIMTISGNLILSLGMVGALSIVRFRTPIKDSMDLVFLFWAITVGIANGAGYYNISIVGSVMIAIFLLLLNKRGVESTSYLLVLQVMNETDEQKIYDELKQAGSQFSLKSKTVSESAVELTLEIKTKTVDTRFVNDLVRDGKAQQATLVVIIQTPSPKLNKPSVL